MPAILVPAIMAGISALSSYLANRKKKEQESEQQQQTNSTQNTLLNNTTDSTPTYDPLQLQMRNFLINTMFNRTNPNALHGLVNNYIGQGTNEINQSAGANEIALKNALAARGLSYSPVAGQALAQGQSNRIGQITGLNIQAPLLEDQLQQQRLTDFGTFMRGLPTGTHNVGTSVGTTTTTGNANTQGSITDPNRNPWAGALGAASQTLANLYGQGAFQTKPKKLGLNESGG